MTPTDKLREMIREAEAGAKEAVSFNAIGHEALKVVEKEDG